MIETTRGDGGVLMRMGTPQRGGGVVQLEPNKNWQDEFLLTQLYNMTSPGTYAVQIRKQHSVSNDPSAPPYMLSNLSKITVTR